MEIIFNNSTYDWSSLEEFLVHHTPSGWTEFFNKPEIKDQLLTISNFLRHESSHDVIIYPSINNIFRALYCVPIASIRTIIIGQDPYHNGAATGLAFDVMTGHKINPSLRNIYKELENCGFSPKQDGSLSHWADQGILLINTSLTVRKGCSESHMEIWEQFFESLMNHIIQYHKKSSLIWFLMGSKAREFYSLIPKTHYILHTTHPSPLSAFRSTKKATSFIGSGCFTIINTQLAKRNHKPINF